MRNPADGWICGKCADRENGCEECLFCIGNPVVRDEADEEATRQADRPECAVCTDNPSVRAHMDEQGEDRFDRMYEEGRASMAADDEHDRRKDARMEPDHD